MVLKRVRSSGRAVAVLLAALLPLILAGCAEWFEPPERPTPTPEPRQLACQPNCAGANLVEANLVDASLANTDLSDAQLDGANLRGANLRNAVLVAATLRGADLNGATLTDADLTDADLSGATLRGANLARATVRDAILAGAELTGADLKGADLGGANLEGADLTAVQGCDVTRRLPGCTTEPTGPGPTEQAPVAVGTIPVITLTVGARPASVNVAGNFNDPDGQTLTYSARSSARAVATAAVSGSTVTVTAVAQGTATITVTATDEDNLTATQAFSVTVNPAPTSELTFPFTEVLNSDGRALTNELYTLELGTSSAQVFVISINTTTGRVAPNIVRLDSGRRAEQISQPRPTASQPVPVPVWLRDLQELPPLRPGGPTDRNQRLAQVQSSVAVGDRFDFIEQRDSGRFPVPATVRKVVRAGTMTLAVWVADREWGATCVVSEQCLTQEMVDAIATRFLRPGANNDIYDWVTTIFGVPWGPHRIPILIPPEAAGQIHILLLDIDGDGRRGTTAGSFNLFHTVQHDQEYPDTLDSAERLIFFVDSALLSEPEGPSWDITDPAPSDTLDTLAHEFQHMIHFYQKLIVHNLLPPPPSEAWLNEMASEVTPDLIADRLGIPGPRGVASNDPTAGAPGNTTDRLARYNRYNDRQVTVWRNDLADYSINYALGAYLARNYGGAALFQKIVQNDSLGVAAIEAALASQGHSVSFADVLTNWAIANLLSDDTGAPHPYRYNSGTWFTSAVGGQTFRLGSINLFNYSYETLNGPYLYSLSRFNAAQAQHPHSNRYVTIGRASGTVRLRINAPAGNRIAVVAKE